jgi:hypothetical protein
VIGSMWWWDRAEEQVRPWHTRPVNLATILVGPGPLCFTSGLRGSMGMGTDTMRFGWLIWSPK